MALLETTDIMTTGQFAAALGDGTKAETIRKYCSEGTIKANQIGRQWVINKDELQRFVANRRPVGRPAN